MQSQQDIDCDIARDQRIIIILRGHLWIVRQHAGLDVACHKRLRFHSHQ